MMSRRVASTACRGVTMIECIGALAILFILVSVFYTAQRNIVEAGGMFRDEQAAVVLVGNVIERAGAEGRVSAARLNVLLDEEFAASRFAEDDAARPVCEPTEGGGMRIGLRHGRRGNLVSVEVGP